MHFHLAISLLGIYPEGTLAKASSPIKKSHKTTTKKLQKYVFTIYKSIVVSIIYIRLFPNILTTELKKEWHICLHIIMEWVSKYTAKWKREVMKRLCNILCFFFSKNTIRYKQSSWINKKSGRRMCITTILLWIYLFLNLTMEFLDLTMERNI